MTVGAIFWLGVLSLVCYIFTSWIAYKEHRLLFWLAWSIGGVGVIVAAGMAGAPVPHPLVLVWSWSLPCLPLWWLGSLVFRHRTPPPPPIDSLSDHKPIFDKDGRQIYP